MKIIEKDDPQLYKKLHDRSGQYYMNSFIWRKVTVTNAGGQIVGENMTHICHKYIRRVPLTIQHC